MHGFHIFCTKMDIIHFPRSQVFCVHTHRFTQSNCLSTSVPNRHESLLGQWLPVSAVAFYLAFTVSIPHPESVTCVLGEGGPWEASIPPACPRRMATAAEQPSSHCCGHPAPPGEKQPTVAPSSKGKGPGAGVKGLRPALTLTEEHARTRNYIPGWAWRQKKPRGRLRELPAL